MITRALLIFFFSLEILSAATIRDYCKAALIELVGGVSTLEVNPNIVNAVKKVAPHLPRLKKAEAYKNLLASQPGLTITDIHYLLKHIERKSRYGIAALGFTFTYITHDQQRFLSSVDQTIYEWLQQNNASISTDDFFELVEAVRDDDLREQMVLTFFNSAKEIDFNSLLSGLALLSDDLDKIKIIIKAETLGAIDASNLTETFEFIEDHEKTFTLAKAYIKTHSVSVDDLLNIIQEISSDHYSDTILEEYIADNSDALSIGNIEQIADSFSDGDRLNAAIFNILSKNEADIDFNSVYRLAALLNSEEKSDEALETYIRKNFATITIDEMDEAYQSFYHSDRFDQLCFDLMASQHSRFDRNERAQLSEFVNDEEISGQIRFWR